MTKNIIHLFRSGLFCAVLVVLYFTTTSTEYDIAENVSDKVSHAMAFLTLSFLADYSFPQVKFSWEKICPLIGYGILIECIQYFLPYRSFSVFDMLADTAGVMIYILSLPLVMQMPALKKRDFENQI